MKSLNKVFLVGNLTRDPEMRYTTKGNEACSFGLTTNHVWKDATGQLKEDTQFHNIVAWNELGRKCSQYLKKGRKILVEGRLATHSWTDEVGTTHTKTEIVMEDMMILDHKGLAGVPEVLKQTTRQKPAKPTAAKQTPKEEHEPSDDLTLSTENLDPEL